MNKALVTMQTLGFLCACTAVAIGLLVPAHPPSGVAWAGIAAILFATNAVTELAK